MSISVARGAVLDLACLRHAWPEWWARGKQIPPPTDWRSIGFLTGRGFGKTAACSEYVVEEVRAGRARRIALIAQSEDKTREVMIEGESGLIATSPPWFKPEFVKGVLVWPNGAQAFPYTPEPPGHDALRGPEHDLAWASEFVAWPAATRDEAYSNLRYGLRLGYGRLIWDTTPKRKHPIIRKRLDLASRDPRHVIVRGTMYENVDNLTDGLIEELVDEYGGTQKGKEELEGIFFDESEEALWRQGWINDHRRDLPAELKRRILSVDPAISTRRGSDRTGIVELGLGRDDQVYVIADLSGKHGPEAWCKIVIERYFESRCDCIVVERDRGGDLVVSNLRAYADKEGVRVEVLERKAKTRHVPGVIYVKEEKASQSKVGRHEPVATMYERGRVSHVRGGQLESLESWLTTWEPKPGMKSPDSIDALVQGVYELANLHERVGGAGKRGFAGIAEAGKVLQAATSPRSSLAKLLGVTPGTRGF